ncbi:MOSC domain-containing protein [Mycobacterium sp. E1214]|uniref:MOSC domain-containing protein n=1 Tax=unclassified Mycobacterium TaxID=2642494 RepID=UPI003513C2BE
MAKLVSVNVGTPKDVSWHGHTVYTGVFKAPVAGPRMVRRLNLDGDGQGDLNGHGGENRAVLVYQLAATQPRVTCCRVGTRLGEPRMAALLVSHRRPGFYCRVVAKAKSRPDRPSTRSPPDQKGSPSLRSRRCSTCRAVPATHSPGHCASRR